MKKTNLEKFLERSELVGNINIIMKKNEFGKMIEEKNKEYGYIKLPNFHHMKEVKVEQKGIEKAMVEADKAIAETGTVILKSEDELFRRATCLAEELNVAVPISKMVGSLEDVAEYMKNLTINDDAYVAFITGASRTADVELVLAMGVHGPRTLNMYIIEDM